MFPQWGQITSYIHIGWARYNGMTARLENRTWHGLTLISNFTWAKDIASSDVINSDEGNTNLYARYSLAGDSALVPRAQYTGGFYYELPFGRGKAVGSSWHPVLNAVAGGWTTSGILTLSTGSPQPATAVNDLTGTGLVISYPNRVCNPNEGGARSPVQWFNTSCFANPPFGTWPNSPLGAVTFPGINNWNATASKFFRVRFPKEGAQLRFRAQFFNALNHTQWGSPNVQFGSQSFGQISSTRPARQIQMALKYEF
jgi:hypothetical protein